MICSKFYQSTPVVLPCGWTVCDTHVKNGELIFGCKYCKKSHEKDGAYTVNMQMNMKFNEKKMWQNLERLARELADFKSIQNDPYNYAYDFFSNIKNQIHLGEQEAIQAVQNHFDLMLTKIDEIMSEFKSSQNEHAKCLETIEVNEYETFVQNESENCRNNLNSMSLIELEAYFNKTNDKLKEIEEKMKSCLNEYLDKDRYQLSQKSGTNLNMDKYFGRLLIKPAKLKFNLSIPLNKDGQQSALANVFSSLLKPLKLDSGDKETVESNRTPQAEATASSSSSSGVRLGIPVGEFDFRLGSSSSSTSSANSTHTVLKANRLIRKQML
jgi:hypothetical protein